ncbi:MAG: hypothetical protein M0Z91_12985 [Actinomycetota bacterium]|jgi:hypothetical protein|nr:hypothetical protein [Actinomycetota bacterium]
MGNLALADLRSITTPQALAVGQTMEVSSWLEPLFPGSYLRRGSVGLIGGMPGSGATTLLFSLLSLPTSKGSWAAVVGLEHLGYAAAAGLGVDLGRVVTVQCPAQEAADVASVMLDGFDLVVMGPLRDAVRARRLVEKARRERSVLIVFSRSGRPAWPERSDFSLFAGGSLWTSEPLDPLGSRSVMVEVGASKRAPGHTARLVAP